MLLLLLPPLLLLLLPLLLYILTLLRCNCARYAYKKIQAAGWSMSDNVDMHALRIKSCIPATTMLKLASLRWQPQPTKLASMFRPWLSTPTACRHPSNM